MTNEGDCMNNDFVYRMLVGDNTNKGEKIALMKRCCAEGKQKQKQKQ